MNCLIEVTKSAALNVHVNKNYTQLTEYYAIYTIILNFFSKFDKECDMVLAIVKIHCGLGVPLALFLPSWSLISTQIQCIVDHMLCNIYITGMIDVWLGLPTDQY